MVEELASLQRETRCSIELKRNAKGEYAWDVKVYYENGQEADAMERLWTVDLDLRRRFLEAS